MQTTQAARHAEPFFQHATTADELERALRDAVRLNEQSMDELHTAISKCVAALRADGMKCEAALLTMKACVRHMAMKHRTPGSSEVPYSGLMMDQIVRWCIQDFYVSD